MHIAFGADIFVGVPDAVLNAFWVERAEGCVAFMEFGAVDFFHGYTSFEFLFCCVVLISSRMDLRGILFCLQNWMNCCGLCRLLINSVVISWKVLRASCSVVLWRVIEKM